MSRLRRLRRDESGSIAMVMVVLVVTSVLIVAMNSQVMSGLKLSRHEGDSASALQVADAGLNAAVEQIPSVALSAGCTGTTAVCFTRSGSVGTGTYIYTVTRDTVETTIWHIDAVGTDSSGVKRRLQADASAVSQYVNPLFVKGTLTYAAGSVLDSFTSGLNNTTGCTGKGIIGLTDGAQGGSPNPAFTSGGGGGANCTGIKIDPSWVWSMDGCTVYGGSNLPPTGTANCPPSNTHIVKKAFPFPAPVDTTGITYGGATFTCWLPTDLKGGTKIWYGTISLQDGCGVDPTTLSAGPAMVYASNFTIGPSSGSNKKINEPTILNCPVSTTGWAYTDPNNNPKAYYCPQWALHLELFQKGTSGAVTIQGSHTYFWGVITADGTISLTSPQVELWGAATTNTFTASSQFSWHYDGTLKDVTNGQFTINSWREVPL